MSRFIHHLGSAGLFVGAAAALLGAPAVAGEGARDDPFARPAAVIADGPVAPSRLDSLEVAGVATVGRQTRVCLADRISKQTRWFEVGDVSRDLVVAEYDRQRDAVFVRDGGESRWIGMRKATVVTMNLPRREHGAIDWAHVAMNDSEKARDAEMMVTDILEFAQRGRSGRVRDTR